MSDLVGTQIVGFLTHRLNYAFMLSTTLPASCFKSSVGSRLRNLTVGEEPAHGTFENKLMNLHKQILGIPYHIYMVLCCKR